MAAKLRAPLPQGLTMKKKSLVFAGLAAASIEPSPGLPIGPGGSPVCLRVLYGESLLSSDTFSGRSKLSTA